MANDDNGCLIIGVIFVASVGYWYFKKDETPKVEAYPPVSTISAAADAATEGANEPLPPPPAPKPPAHNYDVNEGDIYYYQAAVSENDRKNGRSTGNIVGYRFLGRQGGSVILQRVDNYGNGFDAASCDVPCKLIRFADGERMAYNTSSIIGAAFEDAINGKLRKYKPKPQPAPEYWPGDPVIEEPVAEEVTDSPTEPTEIQAD